MRAWIIALGLAAAACVSAQGAADTPSPFAGQQGPAQTQTQTQAQSQAQTQPQAQTPQNFPAIDLPAGAYRIDPRHTSVLFRIRHEGLSWFTARFDTKDASLELNPASPAQS